MGTTRLRRLDIEVDSLFFGYQAEVYEQLNDQISAVRLRRNGNRTYLPEYSTRIGDAFLILHAIKKMDGTYTMSVDKTGCKVKVAIGKAEWESAPHEAMEEAICDVALQVAGHPLYGERLFPLIEDKSDVALAPASQPEVAEAPSLKHAWYDAR